MNVITNSRRRTVEAALKDDISEITVLETETSSNIPGKIKVKEMSGIGRNNHSTNSQRLDERDIFQICTFGINPSDYLRILSSFSDSLLTQLIVTLIVKKKEMDIYDLSRWSINTSAVYRTILIVVIIISMAFVFVGSWPSVRSTPDTKSDVISSSRSHVSTLNQSLTPVPLNEHSDLESKCTNPPATDSLKALVPIYFDNWKIIHNRSGAGFRHQSPQRMTPQDNHFILLRNKPGTYYILNINRWDSSREARRATISEIRYSTFLIRWGWFTLSVHAFPPKGTNLQVHHSHEMSKQILSQISHPINGPLGADCVEMLKISYRPSSSSGRSPT